MGCDIQSKKMISRNIQRNRILFAGGSSHNGSGIRLPPPRRMGCRVGCGLGGCSRTFGSDRSQVWQGRIGLCVWLAPIDDGVGWMDVTE